MGRPIKERIFAKEENIFLSLLKNITLLPNLEQNIDPKKLVLPKLIESFLEDMKVVMGQFPVKSCWLLPMPFNTTKFKTFIVWGFMFPWQGLNAVAFSGYACAHKMILKQTWTVLNCPTKRILLKW